MRISVADRLEAARTELLDLGLRNSLINYRTRARKIDIVDEKSSEIYRILVTEGRAMSFRPIPEQIKDEDSEQLRSLFEGESEEWSRLFTEDGEDDENGGLSNRHSDTKLQTRLGSDSLHAKLLSIHNDARTYIEEQGVNILYLALGFLHWYESDASTEERRAPLLLIPVQLTRTSASHRFRIAYTADEIGPNLSLGEKLRVEFAATLPDIHESDQLDVYGYCRQIESAVSKFSRWTVNPDECVLGFFSFGKFLMYRDLAQDSWPEDNAPAKHPIIKSLLGDGFRDQKLSVPDDANVDELVSLLDTNHVLDADSTQVLAILDVNEGHNLIIQGPPGTGKSQTIANVIAESIGNGKKVLFVSEKMAALEVVKRRLDQVGLGEAALELHSHKTTKKSLLRDLEHTMRLGRPVSARTSDEVGALPGLRKRLNDYCIAVNTPILRTHTTVFEAIGHYLALGSIASSLPRFDFSRMREWDDATFREHRLRIEELRRFISSNGVPAENPFWDAQQLVLLPSDEDKIRTLVGQAIELTLSVASSGETLATKLQLEPPRTTDDSRILCRAAERAQAAPRLQGLRVSSGDWQARSDELIRLISAGARMNQLRANHDDVLIPEAWGQDLRTDRQWYAAHASEWWRIFSSEYRQSRARLAGLCKDSLPRDRDECIALFDALLDFSKQEAVFVRHEGLGAGLFGAQWQGHDSDWTVLKKLVEWILKLYDDIGDGIIPQGLASFLEGGTTLKAMEEDVNRLSGQLEEHTRILEQLKSGLRLDRVAQEDTTLASDSPSYVIRELASKLGVWSDRLSELPSAVNYNILADEFGRQGLEFILPQTAAWRDAQEDLVRAFDATWYGGLIETAYKEREPLRQFNRDGHEHSIESFRKLDILLFERNRIRLAQEHWKSLPDHVGGGELAVINREIQKKRRHLPIRRLITEAGRAIQAMKPVFMMSPMSIANFLPPEAVRFDLVVFDEASQVTPADAFGAILRGNQAVVVGDDKQLPPTTFFKKLTAEGDLEEDEANITSDLESILGLFSAQGAPGRMLRWHYRSRHESLIAVSNYEFYENRLVVYPSPGRTEDTLGLQFTHLPNTAYDRGRTSANPDEARAVAERVMEHAQNRPNLTLGVASFSTAQRNAIEFQLELLRRRDVKFESFFNDHPHEPFFVKNLENVQGDERDVILVSVGYGKTKEGHMTMNFGPLNLAGGERRLNVLVTRARRACEVFANFTADDLNLSRSQSRGVAALHSFLRYARDRYLDQPLVTGRDVDSPFELEVLKALRQRGFDARPQIGSGGFRVDIGIVDPERPGRYMLGVECDGASYHSARSARDRDRLREQVLVGLGWQIYRIWSTDWFRNPEKELERLLGAIDKARLVASVANPKSPPTPSKIAIEPGTLARTSENRLSEGRPTSKSYEEYIPNVPLRNRDLHTLPVAELAGYVSECVKHEGPVHLDVVAQRITTGAGLRRAGRRIRDAVNEGARYAVSLGLVARRGDFLWASERRKLFPRDRSKLEPNAKKLEHVPPEEIRLAIETVVQASISIDMEEAISRALRLIGFQRTTAGSVALVNEQIDRAVEKSRISRNGKTLSMN